MSGSSVVLHLRYVGPGSVSSGTAVKIVYGFDKLGDFFDNSLGGSGRQYFVKLDDESVNALIEVTITQNNRGKKTYSKCYLRFVWEGSDEDDDKGGHGGGSCRR